MAGVSDLSTTRKDPTAPENWVQVRIPNVFCADDPGLLGASTVQTLMKGTSYGRLCFNNLLEGDASEPVYTQLTAVIGTLRAATDSALFCHRESLGKGNAFLSTPPHPTPPPQ